jgi:uncharacterized protein (DUF2267 family)
MPLNYRNTIDVPRLNANPMNMQGRHNRHKSKPLNFEAYAAEGNHFVHEVAAELGSSRNCAARVTRAVLHALRDRMPPDLAIQIAQGLPMALKGIYFDQYDPSHTPVIIRSRRKFLRYVHAKLGVTAPVDLPDPESVREAFRAVFYVLERHLSPGQMHRLKRALNHQLLDLTEEGVPVWNQVDFFKE